MAATRTFFYLLFIISTLLFAFPLSAAEADNIPQEKPIETPDPQSHEAIKQMGEELEADRKAREATAKEKQTASEQEKTESPASMGKEPTKVTKEDVAKLKKECEDAREELIAPLREAAIKECIAKKVKSAADCEKFYHDYGSSGATVGGGFRQRMFHDIPECQPYYEVENKVGKKIK